MKKMLILGPRQNKKDPSKTGGITVLFELLLKELNRRDISYHVIDTLVENNGGKLKTLLKVYAKLLTRFWKAEHISLQATENSFFFVAPLVTLLGKLFHKSTSVRVFAGGMSTTYENNRWFRMVSRFVLKNVDNVFFETKYLVDYFMEFNPHTYWFPNVREAVEIKNPHKEYQKRFIYIGTINEEKGIDLLCDVAAQLPSEFTLDLYGPIIEDRYSPEYFSQRGVAYKGALRPDEVLQVMEQYDVLVLPSYREGYPGVIIEAFMLGLPVIATRLDGIKEMVREDYNGILIDVGDRKQLFDAMNSIDKRSFSKLQKSAKASFSPYSSHERTAFFLKKIGYDA